MLNPCSPCVCPNASCEQCIFGYQSKEANHERMRELLLAYINGEKPKYWRIISFYQDYHPDWYIELIQSRRDELEDESKQGVLKPCPFCGGEAILCKHDQYAYIKCQSCGCNTGIYSLNECNNSTIQALMKTWNKRNGQFIKE